MGRTPIQWDRGAVGDFEGGFGDGRVCLVEVYVSVYTIEREWKGGVKEGVGVVVVRWTSLGCGRRAPRIASGVLAGYANSRRVADWKRAGVAPGRMDGHHGR